MRAAKFEDRSDTVTLNIENLQSVLQCGRATAIRIAREAGAEIRIGKRVLYNRQKIEDFINANSGRL